MLEEHRSKHLQHPGEEFIHLDGVAYRWAAGALPSSHDKDGNYLDRCESLDVDIEELEYFLLAPNEQSVDIMLKGSRRRGILCPLSVSFL